jgi:phage terminase large subunit-like protein
VLGFDGSYANDSTGLVGVTLQGHVFVVDAWEKPAHADEHWKVSMLEVEQAIRSACLTYNVLEIAADPFLWREALETLAAEGLPVVEYTNSPGRMVSATQRFYEAVTQGQLTHDGDSRLARHIDNTVIKYDRQGPRISKESKASQRKIDLSVCAVMAFDRAMQVTPAPKSNWHIY